jgi:hypothetical protein
MILGAVQDKPTPSPAEQIVHFYVIIIVSFIPMHPSSSRILLITKISYDRHVGRTIEYSTTI